MKVLVTGANGQLGHDVIEQLNSLNICCKGVARKDFDITDERAVKNYINRYRPNVVIHCAAYTAVDKAEDEREICYNANVLGTRYAAEACADIDAKMVYISTDYVFDGTGDEPIEVTENPNPINYYGQTKYEGELEVQRPLAKYFIVRISWVFGTTGNNFVKTMLKLAKEKDEISVVSDQIGSPTYTPDMAKLITDMIKNEKYGIYHATNEGYCSWYEFACEIFKIADVKVKVNSIASKDYPTKAKRPKNSRLSKSKLDEACFERLPDYKNALKRHIIQLHSE